MAIPPLAGFTVAVTADRRCDEQVALLERRGASVVVGPTVRTLPLADAAPLSEAIEELVAHPPEYTVLLTGLGVRSLLAAAEGQGRGPELLECLIGTTIIARGPKASGAATTAGLDIAWQTPGERSSEILVRLTEAARRGARIAVQRDGQSQALLADQLAELGADAVDVPVYRWELPDDVRAARRVIDAVIGREVDAVTFTSSPAVRHLLAIAAGDGRDDVLLEAFGSDVTAVCVGPVCAETAVELGIVGAAVPARSRLGAMVQALVVRFADRGQRISAGGCGVTLQGHVVFVDEVPVVLGPRERAVLQMLVAANGAVVAKPRLLAAVWGADAVDEHVVEVTVGRLRRGLGPAGDSVETVPRRGYRLTIESSVAASGRS